MKRHILLVLFRLMLALGVVYSLPISHTRWGEHYPGDGQQAFGFIIIFFVISLFAAVLYLGLGSFGQFLLRKRPARLTVLTDLGLFILFSGVLVYGGVTARYKDSQPNQHAAGSGGIVLQTQFPHPQPAMPEHDCSPHSATSSQQHRKAL